MNTLAITDRRGTITGLVRFEETRDKDAPEARLEPLADQEIHEIELPPELESIESILDLYQTVEREYTLDRDSARLTKNR